MDITITLSEEDYKALSYVAADPEEWVKNVVSERIRKAKDEICIKAIDGTDETVSLSKTKLAKVKDLPLVVTNAKALNETSKNEIVKEAVIKTARQRNEEALARLNR